MVTLTPDTIDPIVRIAGHIAATKGIYWGPRRIPDFELIMVTKGEFSFEGEDESCRIGKDEVILIHPKERNTFANAIPRAGEFYFFHGELFPKGSYANGAYTIPFFPERITRVADARYLRGRFQRCVEVFQGEHKFREGLLSSAVKEIWLMLYEASVRTSNRRISRRMEEVLEYIKEHYHERITRDELAARFRVTPQYMNHLFKKELGITPKELIHRERILAAYRILTEEACTVKEASARVGFDDPFYFSRIFKRVIGVPPREVQNTLAVETRRLLKEE